MSFPPMAIIVRLIFRFVPGFILFVFLVVSLISCHVEITSDQPNIILLMGDDHGWEETGYNGHEYLHTPVLDEMAATGFRLDRFYSASPVCSPTRASVMTGRHPNRCGTFTPNWSIRPEEVTIAKLLAEQGYACAHFGKWHLGPVKEDSPTSPGAMGFDEWLSHDNFFELDPVLSRNGGPPQKIRGESSEILIHEALQFIRKSKDTNKPYFIVVWFGSPHEPYQGLPNDLDRYANLPDSLSQLKTRLTSLRTGLATMRSRDSVLQERYAEITAMDRSIGQLRDGLAAEDLRENTILWYCGDNGVPSSGVLKSPLRGLKGTLYEGGIRVPGIIEWPAVIKNPQSSSMPMVTSDMLPTICELVDIEMPDRPLDGISIKTAIDGTDFSRAPIYFWNYDTQQEMEVVSEPYLDSLSQVGTTPLAKQMGGRYTRSFRNYHHPRIVPANYQGKLAVMDRDYKLVVDHASENNITKELFNITDDPGEKQDLTNQHPAIVDKLEQELLMWQKSVLESLTGADYQ